MQRAEPNGLAQLVAEQRDGRELLLLCDFDGTLCEFHVDPTAVWLPAHRRDMLTRLSRAPQTVIGFVSGRRLADVRMRTRIPRDQAFAAGLHGLEIDGPDDYFVHPDIADARARAQVISAALQPLAAALPGTFLEDKDLSVALHYRDASPADQELAMAAFERVVQPALSAGDVRVMHGACVLEALPAIDWNKGHAVTWIRERLSHRGLVPFTVYLGDDVTDEDAFRATKGHGISIGTSDRVSGADYRLEGPTEVEWFLGRLVSRVDASALR